MAVNIPVKKVCKKTIKVINKHHVKRWVVIVAVVVVAAKLIGASQAWQSIMIVIFESTTRSIGAATGVIKEEEERIVKKL